MLPALPSPNVFVDTALFDPVIKIESSAVKVTLPPIQRLLPQLPKPTEGCPLDTATPPLWLRICAPSLSVKLPTFPVIWPALPSQSVEESIRVPAFMTNDGVLCTEICPPLPGVRSVTAVTEKGGLFKAPSTSSQPALSGRATPRFLIAATKSAKVGVAPPKLRWKSWLSCVLAKRSSTSVGGGDV